MSDAPSRRRQELWQAYAALARTLRTLQRPHPMVPGSLYLLRRRCGKPNCRCAQGQLHAAWVLTRSEAGHRRLYGVPKEQRGRLRSLTREYRRWQRARAQLVKDWAALLARLDPLAQARVQPWPPASTHGPGTA